jgi:hypothetical protein
MQYREGEIRAQGIVSAELSRNVSFIKITGAVV